MKTHFRKGEIKPMSNIPITRGDYVQLPSGDRGTIYDITQDSYGGYWADVHIGIEGRRTVSTRDLQLIYTGEQIRNGQRCDDSEVEP